MKHLTKVLAAASFAVATIATGASQEAFAQKATLLTDDATACEIFANISLDVPSECLAAAGVTAASAGSLEGVKTRGIVINRDVGEDATQSANTTTVLPPEESPAADNDFAVAFRIQFGFDSTDLTHSARSTLDRMAEVLNHELVREKVIQIEGHTDGTGTAAYNFKLSQRRAEAVAAYLVQRHKVESTRLVLKGKGESELYNQQDPADSVNRRVEFKNLSDLASVR